MDQVLNKVGIYWFSKRASEEIDSIGDNFSTVLVISARAMLFDQYDFSKASSQ